MVNDCSDNGHRPMSVLNLAGFLPRSAVNGPGIRAVVWVRGCPFRCEECFNEQFQSPSPITPVSLESLAAMILALPVIDGVTFSGGEPFMQAGPLALLGQILRSAGLNIVTYTGYTLEQLAAGNDPAWPALLAVTDVLVAGPYIAAMAAPDPLKGSSNQQVIPLGMKLAVPGGSGHRRRRGRNAEFVIGQDGTITATGFPAPAVISQLSSRCRGT